MYTSHMTYRVDRTIHIRNQNGEQFKSNFNHIKMCKDQYFVENCDL